MAVRVTRIEAHRDDQPDDYTIRVGVDEAGTAPAPNGSQFVGHHYSS